MSATTNPFATNPLATSPNPNNPPNTGGSSGGGFFSDFVDILGGVVRATEPIWTRAIDDGNNMPNVSDSPTYQGTRNDTTGNVVPGTTTDYTPLLIVGGLAIVAILIAKG